MKRISVALSLVALSAYGLGCAEAPPKTPAPAVTPSHPAGAHAEPAKTETPAEAAPAAAAEAAPAAAEEKKEEAPAAAEEKKEEAPAAAEEKKEEAKPEEKKE